jgi:hypothetical protein
MAHEDRIRFFLLSRIGFRGLGRSMIQIQKFEPLALMHSNETALYYHRKKVEINRPCAAGVEMGSDHADGLPADPNKDRVYGE